MIYRVYDKKEKCWVGENIFLTPNGNVYIIHTTKKGLFGNKKMSLVSSSRFIVHKNIELRDSNNRLIYEGDICKIGVLEIIGVVAYSSDNAAYYLFDYLNNKYYILNSEYCKKIEVVGNVFDNPELVSEALKSEN